MGRDTVVQLVALCAASSFFYISHTLERHSLTESPRLSSFLVFLLSGLICYGVSCITKWFPGADGRFTTHRRQGSLLDGTHDATQKGQNTHLPGRPRRLSLPVLVLCIVLRLEVFHRVNYQQQCATPGLESFLPPLFFAYEIFTSRRKWSIPPPDDPDDPWRSCFDDLIDWFSGPRVTLVLAVLSVVVFSTGTYYATSNMTRSTYYCFELVESKRSTLALQCIGLMLDVIIVILLWRLLAWSRTAKLRLRTLGTVLTLSSLSMGLVWVGSRLFRRTAVLHAGFGFLYGFDIIVDSVAFAALMISATFWVCETSPLTPASIITFLVGTAKACQNIFQYGNYLHPTRLPEITPLYVIAFGMVAYTYTHGIQSVIFIRRFLLLALLFGLAVGTSVFIKLSDPQSFKRHPVSDFIYKANVKQDRWMSEASTSGSLPIAHKIYKDRHSGRDPPPAFADWYELAKDTMVIDKFDQIDQDLAPFRSIPPSKLRQRTSIVSQMPGVHVIGIKDGNASRLPEVTGHDAEALDNLVATINKFAKFLPDMLFPVNLKTTPRILPSWDIANGHSRADLTPIINLISKRSTEDGAHGDNEVKPAETPIPDPLPALPEYPQTERPSSISSASYRQMQVEACAPGSRTRTNPHWNIGEFCASCVRRHSKAQVMVNWERSLEYCFQPDLKYLHGMSLSSPHAEPIRDLLPLFGFSKSEPFKDILIPLPQSDDDKADIGWNFDRRYDAMFWRGQTGNGVISDQALRGNHKFRLLHMLGNQNTKDKVSMILPTANDPPAYRHERVPITEANLVLPLSVGMNNYTGCMGPNCELLRQAYPIINEAQDQGSPLEYRYILLLDKDNGPSPDLLRVLRSTSVPFISTIFRTWYSDRLIPWLHFVPIDTRYQGLHTTLTYFTGTQKKAHLNGRDTDMKGQTKDGAWIAQQGAKWAKKALGEKDQEVYLFRLLLEWGRLIDDKRDEIGTTKNDKGELQNSPWTKHQKW